jgi:DNA topoisomerase-3
MAKGRGAERPPTPAMKRFVGSLAKQLGLRPPPGYTTSSTVCRAFLDQHAPGKNGGQASSKAAPGQRPPARKKSSRRFMSDRGNDGSLSAQPVAYESESSERTRKSNGRTRKPGSRKSHAIGSNPAMEGTLPPDTSGADTPLRIPFGNKELALQLGARYRSGGWYAPPGTDLTSFRQRGWL